jgi:5-formyltetrahydrofolate cyclo-ligase
VTDHDVPLDYIITPDRVIDCRTALRSRPPIGIVWDDLTEDKIAAIPLLSAMRPR